MMIFRKYMTITVKQKIRHT